MVQDATSHRMLSLPESLRGPCSLPLFTVNSKAEVRFHLASADWIEEPVRLKLAVKVSTGPSFLRNPSVTLKPCLRGALVLPLFSAAQK